MRKNAILIIACFLLGVSVYLKAGTITYNFSSVGYWVTESNGTTHPDKGNSALLKNLYYGETNDCFIVKGSGYFSEGYLMLTTNASLKIPHKKEWTINKITLHAHSGVSTSTKVNIYIDKDGTNPASKSLEWKVKDADYEYVISNSYKNTELYVVVKNSNARITSLTIDYTSTNEPADDSSNNSSVSTPIFSPGTTSFSSDSLVVCIDAAEKCNVFYTTDGTTPSYTNAEEYQGVKGNVVTIYAKDSKVTLKAIAVDVTTGKCSNVSSAVYTYVDPSIPNNGTKISPFSVAEIKKMVLSTTKKGVWVKGRIYGTVNGDIDNLSTSNFTVKSNIVIGDSTGYIPIKLESNAIELNLSENPFLQGKEILIQGDLELVYSNALGLKHTKEYTKYEVTYDVPINSYGCTTLFLNMPVTVPSDTIAYYCTTEGKYVNLHPVGATIPPNVGVILKYKPNTTCTLTYTTKKNDNEEAIRNTNQLIGFTQETEIAAGDAYYSLNVKDNRLGFYIPKTAKDKEDAAGGFVAKANKAYLQVPAEQKVKMFLIRRKDDETEIVPTTYFSEDIIYDLQGRVVSSPIQGIYIKAGKKIIVR